ncbi:amidohydrolase family protein [Streptomyces sp. NPDC023723]|uniref:amidohydrolase family protein n=1 Tax=Streptomyces sp. NPDC023723 TaxID=3154323 RepID=UPI00340BFD2F
MSARGTVLVDAHHHVWDLSRRPQPWLDAPEHAPIRRSFGMDDLRTAARRGPAGRRLTRTVLVQCVASVAETVELLALAERDPLVGAVVGWVDLTAPTVRDDLDALLAAPGGDRLRSIRHLVQDERDPGWLQRPDVANGLAAVRDRGLAYDVLVRAPQLPSVLRLAERFPGLPLVLDHAGKPDLRSGAGLRAWGDGIRRLAARPQVTCKVSGLVTEAEWHRWTAEDIRPAWEVLLSAFGPRRLMFGSDWPVCVLAGGWERWAATVEEFLAPLPEADRQAVLADTAGTFYRLPPR